MKKLLIIFTLLTAQAEGAIAYHAQAIDGTTGGKTTWTTNLPTVSDGDYVLCMIDVHAVIGGVPPFSAISGWTSLAMSHGNVSGVEGEFGLFGKFWHTGNATTIAYSIPAGTNGDALSECLSYSGVNASTPIDGVVNYNWFVGQGSSPVSLIVRAPAVAPSWTTDMHIIWFMSPNQNGGGHTLSTPSGYTRRIAVGTGAPTAAIYEKQLASASNTGDVDSVPGGNYVMFGLSFLLMPASGGVTASRTVIPTESFYQGNISIAGAGTKNAQNVAKTGDVLAIQLYGCGTVTVPVGWTQVFSDGYLALITHKYTDGDETLPAITCSVANATGTEIAIRNYNPSGLALVSPAIDNTSSTTFTGATSCVAPSISLSGTNDRLWALFENGRNVDTGIAWTLDAGLLYDNSNVQTQQGFGQGHILSPASPTSTYTSTIVSSKNGSCASIAWKIPSGQMLRHRTLIQ